MKIVNIHEAKTHLSRLIDEAAKGRSFVIAKAGKPLVKVVPIDKQKKPQRTGFLIGDYSIPDDFDKMASKEIEELFGISSK